jgi:hypothetical protein
MAKDFRIKKYKAKKVKGGYQYEGTNSSGKKFTSKVYSSEQSARRDVQDQNNANYLSEQRAKSGTSKPRVKPTPKATTPKATPKKKKTIGGRSPRMDRLVKKHGPSLRKKGASQYDVATMAKNVVEGGDVESWRKRYKMADKPTPKPKPKKRVIGHEQTSTWSGKASDVRKPNVRRKKIYSK